MRTYEIHARTRRVQPAAVVVGTVRIDAIAPWLARAYHAVAEFLTEHGSYPVGPPFARYHRLAGDAFRVEAGFPVAVAIEGDGAVRPYALPAGPVAATTHVGPYDAMLPGYTALTTWIAEQGGEPDGDPWEVYLSDPEEEPDPATWRTEIVQPYRTG